MMMRKSISGLSLFVTIVLVLLLLLLIVVVDAASDNEASNDDEDDRGAISLIGLGGMGMAIAKCLTKNGYTVHGWNRSPRSTGSMDEERFIIHSTPNEAISSSNITFFVINSDSQLQTIHDFLLQTVENTSIDDDDDNNNNNNDITLLDTMKGKTIVNMVNHQPFAVHELDLLLQGNNVTQVVALLFGVPETVCSSQSHILVSSSSKSNNLLQKTTTTQITTNASTTRLVTSSLNTIGLVHEFSSNDIGLASIVYLCLIQSLYFGLAGYELSILILTKYVTMMILQQQKRNESENDTSNINSAIETIINQFQKLASTLLSTYIPAFMPIISNTITKQQWDQSYVPASAMIDMFDMHQIVFDKLGLLQDSYHTVYTKYLRQTVESAEQTHIEEVVGVSAVVQHYSTDGFQLLKYPSSSDDPRIRTSETITANDEEL